MLRCFAVFCYVEMYFAMFAIFEQVCYGLRSVYVNYYVLLGLPCIAMICYVLICLPARV